MTDKRVDIFGFGVATVDDLIVVGHFPLPNDKQPVLEKVRQGGGLTGTALVAASRLGCACTLAISLGEDELSRYVRHTLGAEVELLENPAAGGSPFHSVIINESGSGERSILWDNSNTLPPAAGERELRLAGEAGCLFVDHVFADAALPVARAARDAGTPLVGDFERSDGGALELLALTDHVIVPLGFAVRAVGEAVPEEAVRKLLRGSGRTLVCVTDSERGCWWGLGDNPGIVHHQPAFKAEKVVDSTGCGDVFHGVYAACLVRGLPPAERIRRASAAACIKAGKIGAQAGAPTLAELEAFLAGA